jgi:hypothetical protein
MFRDWPETFWSAQIFIVDTPYGFSKPDFFPYGCLQIGYPTGTVDCDFLNRFPRYFLPKS